MKHQIHRAALATTLCLALLPVQAAALMVTDRPQPGTTLGQPFEHDPNTAGSNSFRIPGLTTLRDGSLPVSYTHLTSWPSAPLTTTARSSRSVWPRWPAAWPSSAWALPPRWR